MTEMIRVKINWSWTKLNCPQTGNISLAEVKKNKKKKNKQEWKVAMCEANGTKIFISHCLSIANSKGLFQFSTFLLNFTVEVTAHSFLSPTLFIKFAAPLFFGVSNHIRHSLETSKVFFYTAWNHLSLDLHIPSDLWSEKWATCLWTAADLWRNIRKIPCWFSVDLYSPLFRGSYCLGSKNKRQFNTSKQYTSIPLEVGNRGEWFISRIRQIPEFLVDWQWKVKSCSFVPSVYHPLPRRYRNKLFFSARFLQHYCFFYQKKKNISKR